MRAFDARILRDESGVALPLALLGLVSVSLLVTTAMLTSSTEYAISAADQDATRALYVAEGGLQAFVAENGTVLGDFAGGSALRYQPAGSSSDEAVDVSVIHMGTTTLSGSRKLRIYSVSAEPAQGGTRSVMSMVRQVIPAPNPLSMNVTSALTLGSNLDVNGNAFTISGNSTTCNSTGVEAARLASGATVTTNNTNMLDNFTGVNDAGQVVSGSAAIQSTTMSRAELAADVLQGQTLSELIAQLPDSVKWGPRYTPAGTPLRTFSGTVGSPPGVAVVDANGGYVNVSSGSGLLIVVNGNLEMQGSSTFDGAIIVEGSFWLHGTPTVTGALISLAYDADNRIELDETATASGHITVQYDKCKVDAAADGFGTLTQDNQTPQVQATFSWLEVTG